MTLDQTIQVWDAVGNWLAGAATVAAVIISLRLARRAERIRLRTNVGLRLVFAGDGTPAEEHVAFVVVNLGDRPVTVHSIGWRVGKGKDRRMGLQPVYGQYTEQYPKQLAHGEQATFMVSLMVIPSWPREFATDFVKSSRLSTLRALIHTSVGETIEVVPEPDLLKKLFELSS